MNFYFFVLFCWGALALNNLNVDESGLLNRLKDEELNCICLSLFSLRLYID